MDGSTGIVVPTDDPQALAAAMEELLKDPEQASSLGAAAKARAVKEFSRQEVHARLVDYVRALLVSG